MNIGIVGGGISGLSLANMLKNKHRVVVLEQNDKPGGLIRCASVNGNLYHLTGGHVFNSKNKDVLNWFWQFFDKDTEFTLAKRNAAIMLNRKLIGYPIENFLYQLPNNVAKNVITDLLNLNDNGVADSFDDICLKYKSFEDFLLKRFGETLYNLYFEPYNRKIWQTPLSEIPLLWLEGKLPMPDVTQILQANILRESETGMVHSSFFYPKANGSQFIIDRLALGLTVIPNFKVCKIESENNKVRINDDFIFDVLIYTGNILEFPSILEDEQVLNIINTNRSQFKFNSTSNFLCTMPKNDLSWLYLPDVDLAAHRIIYTGNFSSANNAVESESSCVVEFSGCMTENEMIDEIRKISIDLKQILYNFTNYSYVIQGNNTRNLIKDMKGILEPRNIFLLGRFAEWEYYNMDKCIESAMIVATEIDKRFQ